MKKGIAFFIASIIIASFVFADELDDEIQKLEKETKLLELQNKNKELKSNKLLELRNKNKELKSNKQDELEKTKNGIFIGLEGGLGTNSYNYDGKTYGSIDESLIGSYLYSISSVTFDLGLMGGYQHYFGKSQRHGIKASAHIYSGFGNSWKREVKQIRVYGDMSRTYNYSYIPIKFGFDVKYLWDFLERGKHTLGLNAGLGWEFDWYVNGEWSSRWVNGLDFKGKDPAIFSHGVYPVIGLHYYYGRHQFEALYRFGGILELIGEYSEVTYSTFSGNKYVDRIYLLSNSYFTLNYAYRF